MSGVLSTSALVNKVRFHAQGQGRTLFSDAHVIQGINSALDSVYSLAAANGGSLFQTRKDAALTYSDFTRNDSSASWKAYFPAWKWGRLIRLEDETRNGARGFARVPHVEEQGDFNDVVRDPDRDYSFASDLRYDLLNDWLFIFGSLSAGASFAVIYDKTPAKLFSGTANAATSTVLTVSSTLRSDPETGAPLGELNHVEDYYVGAYVTNASPGKNQTPLLVTASNTNGSGDVELTTVSDPSAVFSASDIVELALPLPGVFARSLAIQAALDIITPRGNSKMVAMLAQELKRASDNLLAFIDDHEGQYPRHVRLT